MNFLSLDVGTTRCKCQLFSESGEILAYRTRECPLTEVNGARYVDIDGIMKSVKSLIAYAAAVAPIYSVCISSFGEAFVLLDGKDGVLFPPIPFTDSRGTKEAREIEETFDVGKLYKRSGTMPSGIFSVSKLLWIKRNRPDLFERAEKALLICDYVGYILTGECVIDYALASRTGAFDKTAFSFDGELLSKLGIDPALFSSPERAGRIVGKIRPQLCKELGLNSDCVLVLGSHDQVCTAIGAGVLSKGDAVDGLGTAECITAVFDAPLSADAGRCGYCTVPYLDGLYCTYLLGNTCGGLTDWFVKITSGSGENRGEVFAHLEKGMKKEPSGILCLPHFAGAGTPYGDAEAKGAFVNLSSTSTVSDMYKAVLEGLAMEMRLNTETVSEFGVGVCRAVATGGGANSSEWLQIKADIQNIPIRTLRSSEGGLCGCAMLQAVSARSANNLREAARVFVRYGKEYIPNAENHEIYEEQYKKYKILYKTLKELRL